MRLMGLDVGEKTIGVAISDELGISAHPVTVIRRAESIKRDIGEVRKLAEQNGVERIVVGMPVMLDGSTGIQAEKVQDFVDMLKPRINVPVDVWDERLSTVEVERVLIDAGESRAKRGKVIDKLAAAVILQSYMDSRRTEDQQGWETDAE